MQLERSLAQANQGRKGGSGGEIAARAVFVDIDLENNVSYPTVYFCALLRRFSRNLRSARGNTPMPAERDLQANYAL
jgi:hypothetical protein